MKFEVRSKPRASLKGVAMAVVLSAAASQSFGAAMSNNGGYNSLNMSRLADGRADIADAGTPAFAYNDGFWDVRHKWHPWFSDDEMLSFRRQSGSRLHAWDHDRTSDFGWLRR